MNSVLLLCKAFPPVAGGVETFSEQVARAYVRAGIQVTIITQTDGDRGWRDQSYPEGRIALFNTGDGGQLRTALKMLWAVYQTTRRTRFDFYHATTWRPAIALVVARHRSPTAVTVHGREVLRVPTGIRPVMLKVFRRADTVATVSAATRTRVAAHLQDSIDVSRWIVARNGLSYATEDRRSDPNVKSGHFTSASVRFLTLARLVERKNVQGCLSALQQLWDSGNRNFEYRIAGKGPLFNSLIRQLCDSDLGEVVQFLGYVDEDDVPDLYRWADVFLHPQIDLHNGEDFEGFGLSIADAMSFGCLAIAGSGSGPSDFIEHGVTGLLVDGADQRQIQSSILSVLNNPQRYMSIATRGQQHVISELSWDKHVHAVLADLRATPANLKRPHNARSGRAIRDQFRKA